MFRAALLHLRPHPSIFRTPIGNYKFHLTEQAKKDQNHFNDFSERTVFFDDKQYHRYSEVKSEMASKSTAEIYNFYYPPSNYQKIIFSPSGEKAIFFGKNNFLGAGKYGAVHWGVDLETREQYAIKISSNLPDIRSNLNNESACLKKIHPGNFFHLPTHQTYYQVMPLAFGITLNDYKAQQKGPDLKEILQISKQLVQEIEKLHRHGFLHRDIKLDNIIWDLETKKLSLIDYGFAAPIADQPHYQDNNPNGTAIHLAPECLTTYKYCEKSDFYGAGVTLAFLMAEKLGQVTDRYKNTFVNLKNKISKNRRNADYIDRKTLFKEINVPEDVYQSSIPEIYQSTFDKENITTYIIHTLIKGMTAIHLAQRFDIETIFQFIDYAEWSLNLGFNEGFQENQLDRLLKYQTSNTKLASLIKEVESKINPSSTIVDSMAKLSLLPTYNRYKNNEEKENNVKSGNPNSVTSHPHP